MTTLHILPMDKFTPDFINFVNNHFSGTDQKFVTFGDEIKYPFTPSRNHIHFGKYNLFYYFYVLINIQFSQKIVLHSLFDIRLTAILFFNRWVLKKSYWVIWGRDLYSYKLDKESKFWAINEFIRRPVLSNMGNVVTNTDGDVALLRAWYSNNKANHYKCLVYPSNLFKEHGVTKKHRTTQLIQIGNSGDPSNNHKKIFDLLLNSKLSNFKLFCPLAYGNKKYIENIIISGDTLFSERFNAQLNLVTRDKYLKQLADVDIAIFGHSRQQALGNIITLLGMGKTVYINIKSSLWPLLKSYDLKVHSTFTDNIELQDSSVSEHNIILVKDNFSEKNLIKSLKRWVL